VNFTNRVFHTAGQNSKSADGRWARRPLKKKQKTAAADEENVDFEDDEGDNDDEDEDDDVEGDDSSEDCDSNEEDEEDSDDCDDDDEEDSDDFDSSDEDEEEGDNCCDDEEEDDCKENTHFNNYQRGRPLPFWCKTSGVESFEDFSPGSGSWRRELMRMSWARMEEQLAKPKRRRW
jgi:hypothetical protein